MRDWMNRLIPCRLCCQNIVVNYEERHEKKLCSKCKVNPKHWIK